MALPAMVNAAAAIEGFAVETDDGLIFTVKGLIHPPARVIAYLRYVQDPNGDRERGGRRFRRVYQFEEQETILVARRPGYLMNDPTFGGPVQAVPRQDIRLAYGPCRRLQRLAERGPTDSLEEAALALAGLFSASAGVPARALGLSGSLLVGLHRPSSDIDIVVYGEQEARAVHGALSDLLADPRSSVSRPREAELTAIHEAHRTDTPLSEADFARLQAGKVNEGRFAERSYFVRFVKRPEEVGERYGDPRYETLGPTTVRARVHDDRESIFTPCRYTIGEATSLEGAPIEDLRQIVSLRGRFADQAKTGDWILARGGLEMVVPLRAACFCQLVVGGRPGDYLTSVPSDRRGVDHERSI